MTDTLSLLDATQILALVIFGLAVLAQLASLALRLKDHLAARANRWTEKKPMSPRAHFTAGVVLCLMLVALSVAAILSPNRWLALLAAGWSGYTFAVIVDYLRRPPGSRKVDA